MDTTSTRHATDRPTDARPLSKWDRVTVAVLVSIAVLYLFLETVVRIQTKDPVEPMVLALLVGDLLVAGLLLGFRRRWMPLLASALLLLGLVGAIPHDLPAVIHPDNVVHFLFSLLVLGLPVVGIVSSVQSVRAEPGKP